MPAGMSTQFLHRFTHLFFAFLVFEVILGGVKLGVLEMVLCLVLLW